MFQSLEYPQRGHIYSLIVLYEYEFANQFKSSNDQLIKCLIIHKLSRPMEPFVLTLINLASKEKKGGGR